MLQNLPDLPKTMASVICHAPEDYRLEEIPVPEVGPGEVLVKVASAGICASDLKCYLGAPLFWGSLAFSLAVAAVAAFPVNRWLIARGKGHAVVHAYHPH